MRGSPECAPAQGSPNRGLSLPDTPTGGKGSVSREPLEKPQERPAEPRAAGGRLSPAKVTVVCVYESPHSSPPPPNSRGHPERTGTRAPQRGPGCLSLPFPGGLRCPSSVRGAPRLPSPGHLGSAGPWGEPMPQPWGVGTLGRGLALQQSHGSPQRSDSGHGPDRRSGHVWSTGALPLQSPFSHAAPRFPLS